MRYGTALVLLLVLLAGVPRLLDPQTLILLQAVRDLGPISGWRCARSETYTYDPSRERPDPTLLADPPEAAVLAQVPWLEIEHVEANLRGGDTLVTARELDADRVYVLAPGTLQSIRVQSLGGDATLCNVHLSNWQIVGEQELG